MNKQTIEQIEESIRSLEELKKTLVEPKAGKVGLWHGYIEEKENEMWKPKKGDYYFSVRTDGLVVRYDWTGQGADEGAFDVGNCFKTKEEAEKYKLRLQSMAYKPFLPKLAEDYWVVMCAFDALDVRKYAWSNGQAGIEDYLLGRIRRTKEEAEEWITKFQDCWSL